MLGRRSNQARLPDGVANWTYAAGMDGTPGHDDMPGQPAPSRGESLWAHAEGSISEDVILAGARERATDIGAGAVTPAVGALLCLLAKLSGGKAVAEVGTGAGVSGLWLLSGMRDDGVLTTIDIEPEHLRLARQAFAEAGIGPSRTRLISGRAQEVLTRLADASYDLVFIDATRSTSQITSPRGCGCCDPAGSSSCTGRRWAVGPVIPGRATRGDRGSRGGPAYRRG